MKRLALVALMGWLAVGLAACDSNAPMAPTPTPDPVPTAPPPAPTPAPVPPPPTPTPTPSADPFTQIITGTVINFKEVNHRLVVPRNGTATFKLTWASTAVDLDLGLTADSCTAYFNNTCIRFDEGALAFGAAEELTRAVKAGDVLRVWVINYEHSDQAYSLSIDIR